MVSTQSRIEELAAIVVELETSDADELRAFEDVDDESLRSFANEYFQLARVCKGCHNN